jgi:hypothetical protein
VSQKRIKYDKIKEGEGKTGGKESGKMSYLLWKGGKGKVV